MRALDIPKGTPTKPQLTALEERAASAIEKLRGEESEVRLPLFIEFAGSPKSGKTTVIGVVSHFLKRLRVSVAQPAEGASLRTPAGLRDDWLTFNAWSGCYALQEILVECSIDPPRDIVLLDRGLFDVAAWMEFLCASQQRITAEDRDRIAAFFTLDVWRHRENAVFLFTADHETSLERENHDKLTSSPGSVMNPDTLRQLLAAYETVALREPHSFERLYHVDTSRKRSAMPSFQQIAYVVADRIVELIEELSTQMLLVTERVGFEGYQAGPDIVRATVEKIIRRDGPRFLERREAEASPEVQQVVPYAVLEDQDGKYFWARRRAQLRRKELEKKYTILVGGHAERRDWNEQNPEEVFERCLRRELEEELVGIQILSIKPLGFVSDTRNNMGAHHLAYVHRVQTGGRAGIRRQAIDQEFGRESVSWKTPEEIKASASDMDPWSQIVAHALFGAALPSQDLFSKLGQ